MAIHRPELLSVLLFLDGYTFARARLGYTGPQRALLLLPGLWRRRSLALRLKLWDWLLRFGTARSKQNAHDDGR